MTPRFTPWFPPANYQDDFSKAGRYHFIHEMTHVLQSQQGNWNFIDAPGLLVGNMFNYDNAYPYNFADLGKPLHEFNMEQQANIVADYATGRFSGETLDRCKQTLQGFQTQPPSPPPRYIQDIENANWGQPGVIDLRPDTSYPWGGRF